MFSSLATYFTYHFKGVNHFINLFFLGIFFFIFGLANFSLLNNLLVFFLFFFVLKEMLLRVKKKENFFLSFLGLGTIIFFLAYVSQPLNYKIGFTDLLKTYTGILVPFYLWEFYGWKNKNQLKQRWFFIFFFSFIFWFYISFLLRKIDFNPDYYLTIINHKTYNFLLLVSFLLVLFDLIPLRKKNFVLFFHLMVLGFGFNLLYLLYLHINELIQGFHHDNFSLNYFFTYRLTSPYRVAITLSVFFSQFILLILGLLESNHTNKNRPLNLIYFFFLFFFFICLILNWSKFNIVFFFFLLVIWSIFLFRKRAYRFFLVVILGLSLIMLVTNNPVSKRIKNTVQVLITPENENIEHSVSTRYFLYLIGIENFKKYPITGTGAFTFGDSLIQYPQYRDKIKLPYHRTTIPHSDILNLLSENGIIGFLLFYSFIGILLVAFFNDYRRNKKVFSLAVFLAFINFISNGLTDFNFKSTEMIMLSFYTLFYLHLKGCFKLDASD